MKQLLQNLKTGEGVVADVPAPVAMRGRVIVRAAASLVSAGTERAFVELGRKGLVGKAKERPDLVRKVVEKVRSEGLLNTLQSVREKLDESHALGYSAAGIVVEVGEGVTEFRAGERVACAGTGYAAHAELLSVPKNLCARLPDAVEFEWGAFATVGAIALQGVRLAEPTLGESVVVIGLGLIGQLAAQLLRANGCRVFGVDLDASKVELAKTLGADDVLYDESINLVVIATRHDTHAGLARRALERGLNVFLEKPLALDDASLDSLLAAASESPGMLAVGFNRRFSPHARAAKDFFREVRAPLSILYRVNAGRTPRAHWTQDPREGGGRIVGEVCHFVDFMQFMTGSLVERVYAEAVTTSDREAVGEDSVFVTLKFADGSNGTIAYLAEGDRALRKERAEIFGGGRAFVLEDYRSATAYRDGRETTTRLRAQDKGQRDELRALFDALRRDGPAPVTLAELANTTRATFRILDSLRTGEAVSVIEGGHDGR